MLGWTNQADTSLKGFLAGCFDPELFPHNAHVKIFATLARNAVNWVCQQKWNTLKRISSLHRHQQTHLCITFDITQAVPFSLYFFPLSPFPHSLSISLLPGCRNLWQFGLKHSPVGFEDDRNFSFSSLTLKCQYKTWPKFRTLDLHPPTVEVKVLKKMKISFYSPPKEASLHPMQLWKLVGAIAFYCVGGQYNFATCKGGAQEVILGKPSFANMKLQGKG